MKAKKERKGKSSFEKDFAKIVKQTPVNTVDFQWKNNGDSFAKFSLYEHYQTTATPNTTF